LYNSAFFFRGRCVGPDGKLAGVLLRDEIRGAKLVGHIGVIQNHVDLPERAIIARHNKRVALIIQMQALIEIAGASVLRPDRGLRKQHFARAKQPLDEGNQLRMRGDVVEGVVRKRKFDLKMSGSSRIEPYRCGLSRNSSALGKY
jgi:hypothetical protein